MAGSLVAQVVGPVASAGHAELGLVLAALELFEEQIEATGMVQLLFEVEHEEDVLAQLFGVEVQMMGFLLLPCLLSPFVAEWLVAGGRVAWTRLTVLSQLCQGISADSRGYSRCFAHLSIVLAPESWRARENFSFR